MNYSLLDKLTILCFGSKVAKTIFLVNSFAPVILLNKVDLPEFVYPMRDTIGYNFFLLFL